MTRKVTRITPGFRAQGPVAIYGSGNQSQGQQVWETVRHEMERGRNVWLEYGPGLGYEDASVESIKAKNEP